MVKNSGIENSGRNERTAAVARRDALKLLGAGVGGSIAGARFGMVGVDRVAAAPTVIDDFEDSDITEYAGNTGEYEVEQSTALEGSHRLECTGSYGKIAGSTKTPRGYEYKCRLIAGSGSGGKPSLLVSVQDRQNPTNRCYWLTLDIPNSELRLFRRDNGSSIKLDAVSVSASEGTEYRGAIELASNTVKAVIYDASGSKLTETTAVNDTTYSGGYFGFYTGGNPGYPSYYDYVTKASLDSTEGSDISSSVVIDGFESGDLDTYECDIGQKGESGASCCTSPVHTGDFGLQIADTNTEMICTSGLDNYAAAGNTFTYLVRVTAEAKLTNFTYGVQDHENRYYVTFDYEDDAFRIFKYKNDSSQSLDGVSGLGLSANEWYRVKASWSTDGTHTATLMDNSGSELATISASDSEWTEGGIGFDGYLSSGESIYYEEVALAHQTELVIEETDNEPVDYKIVFSDQTVSGRRLESSDQISDNSDGTTTVSGAVNNGMDACTYGKDTHIKSIRVSGRGNIEMAIDGNVDERTETDGIEIKGTDKDGDGSSPSIPYSFSVNGPTAPNKDLESDDEESGENSVSGTITPGDSDYYFADSQFTEVHANVKKDDEVLIQRYST